MVKNLNLVFLSLLSFSVLQSCGGTKFLKAKDEKQLQINEYDTLVTVKPLDPPPTPSISADVPLPSVSGAPTPSVAATPLEPLKKNASKPKKTKSLVAKEEKTKVPEKRQPEIEDTEGFVGRRPVVDPFRPGEKSVLKIKYFNITAGDVTVETLPFVEVNGRKSYHFRVSAQTNSVFSSFYSVDDVGETFMDYEDMIPYNFAVHVKETKQLREVRAFFDWSKMQAKFWERKVTSDYGVETKNREWTILPYSQNIFTSLFYLRTFQLRPGKNVQFRVADEEKNIVVTGKTLRREKLETPKGELQTLVLQPEIQIEGVFKPVGDVFFWFTDDDRKMLVRLEAKIKIGKIIGQLEDLQY